MEVISSLKSEKKKFKYVGNEFEFVLIFLKNAILTLITLGLYYPWSKVEQLKHQYQNTNLENAPFTFHGSGKEVFKGFIKIYIITILLYVFLILGAQFNSNTSISVFVGILYLLLLLILPFAIHGAAHYQSSKSSWKGIHFKYLGDKMELFWKFTTGFILTVFTLGIYASWFSVDIRKYIFSHLRFGNLSFSFKGNGESLFWINLKFILLVIPTLGVYSFWYYQQLITFYAKNTEITQNGKNVNVNINMQIGDVFELGIVNALITLFTLGIAYPWVKIRTLKFIFRFLEIEEGLNTNNIQKVAYENEANPMLSGFLDLDFL